MDEILTRFVENMIGRVSGLMKFRIILQPLMASLFGILAGLRDAKAGKPPYFWTIFSKRAQRVEMLKDGWKSVGRVFVIAMLLDVVYQLIVQRWIYPGEVIVVAFILAILPYLILRGLVNRLSRL